MATKHVVRDADSSAVTRPRGLQVDLLASNGHARFLQSRAVVVMAGRNMLRGEHVDECPDENYPIHKNIRQSEPPHH